MKSSLQQPPVEILKLLTEVSQLLTSLDLETVMKQVVDLMSNTVGAQHATLFLHTEGDIDWDHIFLTRDTDLEESRLVMRTILDEGLAGWVMRHRQSALVYDTETDPRWIRFPDDQDSPRSVLCVPFIHNEDVLAVLTLAHPEPAHFTEQHLEVVTIVGYQAGVAIRNAQHFHESRAQQRQLEMILQALPEILFVLDGEGRILRINNGVQTLLGVEDPLEPQAIIGHQLREFVAEGQPGHLLTPAQKYIEHPGKGMRPWSFETRDEQAGRDYQVVVSTWDIPDTPGGGFIVLMHDITTLRDLSRFKDEMLRVVSHDLRSPLALIISARELLDSDLGDQAEDSLVARYLDIIKQSTDRMEGLLHDLLRADPSSKEQIDVEILIRRVAERIWPLAEEKQQTIHLDLNFDSRATILGDPMLLGEAVENYMTNAVKYTPSGGAITVHASVDKGRLNYFVEDNGPGIAEEHIPQLFEAYFRTPEQRNNGEKGYGIGLNLVKTIVHRHGGDVWVESTEQVGSRFGLWLPLD